MHRQILLHQRQEIAAKHGIFGKRRIDHAVIQQVACHVLRRELHVRKEVFAGGAGADEAKNSTGFTPYCFCAAIAASYATSEPVQCPKNATGF